MKCRFVIDKFCNILGCDFVPTMLQFHYYVGRDKGCSKTILNSRKIISREEYMFSLIFLMPSVL